MALYNTRITPQPRSDGTAPDRAAYRRRLGRYAGRGDLVHSEIVLPPGVRAPWAEVPGKLWEAAEACEVRCDARTSREYRTSLPRGFDHGQLIALARRITRMICAVFKCAADFSVHEPRTGTPNTQPHVHIMTTTREVGPGGLGQKCLPEWSDERLMAEGHPAGGALITFIRAMIAGIINAMLAFVGRQDRVDHRSYASYGLLLTTICSNSREVAVDLDFERMRRSRNARIIARNASTFLTIIAYRVGERPSLPVLMHHLAPLVGSKWAERVAAFVMSKADEPAPSKPTAPVVASSPVQETAPKVPSRPRPAIVESPSERAVVEDCDTSPEARALRRMKAMGFHRWKRPRKQADRREDDLMEPRTDTEADARSSTYRAVSEDYAPHVEEVIPDAAFETEEEADYDDDAPAFRM